MVVKKKKRLDNGVVVGVTHGGAGVEASLVRKREREARIFVYATV